MEGTSRGKHSPQDTKVLSPKELLHLGVISDAELRGRVAELSQEERKELGMLIADRENALDYVLTFYECWPSFDLEVQKQYAERIKEEEPEKVLLIVPFVNLSKWEDVSIDPNDGYQRTDSKLESWMKGDVRRLIQFTETIIAYRKAHPDLASLDSVQHHSYSFQITPDNRFTGINFFQVFGHASRNKVVLWPLVKQLVETGLLRDEPETLNEFFKINSFTSMVGAAFLTAEEHQYFAEYREKEEATDEEKQQAFEVRQRIYSRAATYIADGFSGILEVLPDPNEFIWELRRQSIPMQDEFARLSLNPKQQEDFLTEGVVDSDFIIGVFKQIQLFPEADQDRLRDVLFHEQIRRLKEHPSNQFSTDLELYLSNYTDEQQEALIEAISTYSFSSWANNPKAALKYGIPFEKLLDLMAGSGNESFTFFENYQGFKEVIQSDVRSQDEEREGHLSRQLEDVLAFKLQSQPELAVNPFLKKERSAFLPDEKLHAFIEEQLSKEVVSLRFLIALLDSDVSDAYRERVRSMVRSDVSFLEDIDHHQDWLALYPLLTDVEWMDYMDETFDRFPFENGFARTYGFLKLFIDHPEYAKELFQRLHDTDRHEALVSLRRSFIDYKENQLNSFSVLGKKERYAQRMLHEIAGLKKTLARDLDYYPEQEVENMREKLRSYESTYEAVPVEDKLDAVQRKQRGIEIGITTLTASLDRHLLESSEDIPGFAIDHWLMTVEGLDVKVFVERDIEEALRVYPELLLVRTSGRHVDLEHYLGRPEYFRLFKQSILPLAYQQTHEGVRNYEKWNIMQELKEVLRKKDILRWLEGEVEFEKGFYETIMPDLYECAWYSVFQNQLEAIVANDTKRHGVITDTSETTVDPQFFTVANRMGLFAESRFIKRHEAHFFALDPQEHEGLFALLDLAIRYGDDRLLMMDPTEMTPKQLEDEVYEALLPTLKAVFDLPKSADYSFEQLDANLVVVLSKYYQRTCRDEGELAKTFQSVLPQMFSGQFESWRAWGAEGEKVVQLERLKQEALVPTGVSLEQYEAWVEEEQADLSEVMGFSIEHLRSSLSLILERAEMDWHISTNDVSFGQKEKIELEQTIDPLKPLLERIGQIKGQFAQARVAKKKGLAYEMPSDALKEEWAELKAQVDVHVDLKRKRLERLELQRFLRVLLSVDAESLEKQRLFDGESTISFERFFRNLKTHFADKHDFLRDIERMERELAKSRKAMMEGSSRLAESSYRLTDRVDQKVAMFIGEIPVPTCQHYESDGRHNRGLLSTAVDPSVKIVQMFDEKENLIARSILRLMEDSQGRPQLFMERVYSVDSHPNVKKLIQKFAKQKADKIGVSLYKGRRTAMSEGEEVMKSDGVSLKNVGSRTPFVYSDNAAGLQTETQFYIDDVIPVE